MKLARAVLATAVIAAAAVAGVSQTGHAAVSGPRPAQPWVQYMHGGREKVVHEPNGLALTYYHLNLYYYPGMCVDVPNDSTANGTKVQLWTCHNVPQEWWRYGGPNGPSEIINEAGMCLDDTAGGGAGTRVQVWHCILNDFNQAWGYGGASANWVWANANGYVLDNTGNLNQAGNPIQMWRANGFQQQAWYGLNA